MLVLTGVWPIENPNVIYKVKRLLSWISAFGLSGILLTEFIYDIRDFTKLSETLYIGVTYMGFLVKLLVFSRRRKEFLNLLKFLKNPIFVSYPEDLDHYMAKSIKQSVLLARVYRVLGVSIVVGYAFYPILDNKPLPFPFPYDLGNYTILMYCLQMIGEAFSAVNNLCLDVMCTSLMGLAAAQLDILTQKIIRLKEDNGVISNPVILNQVDARIIEKLKDCVKHHLAIIKYRNSKAHANADAMSRLPVCSEQLANSIDEPDYFEICQIETLPVTAKMLAKEFINTITKWFKDW
ncbi:hypothetical protein ILUMI_02062 [Ignelater luminosus]|uniref:Odorant receptor n=1 Tax=Ignelater luminosus TaxID=2038154 RepID=A0A8K0GL56_IGNLU|nr:hypothetical protein ILUMI_02062 [Ignelater luminosus]